MENKENVIIYTGVPMLLFKEIIDKQGNKLCNEYESDILTDIIIQEYAGYNMIILKTNVDDTFMSNIKEVGELILKESSFNCDMEYVNSDKTYKNMKLLLKLRESNSGERYKSEFYYIFADDNISLNALKKELNWMLDREINKQSANNYRNVDLDVETKSSLKELNGNLTSIQNMIDKSINKLVKQIADNTYTV